MSDFERALIKDPFQIDQTQCHLAAQVARAFNATEEENPWSSYSAEAQACFKLFFIAICHQINWDVMQSSLFRDFFSDDCKAMLARASSMEPEGIQKMLAGYH